MNILVTGATGFIGRHLVEELSKSKENNIFCVIRNKTKAKLIEKHKVNLVYVDITEYKDLESKLINKNIDIVYHAAGYVSLTDKENLEKINVLGTENICKLSLKLNVKKLIYLSSVAVVGGNIGMPIYEDSPYLTTNVYGHSKALAEKKAISFRDQGLKVVIIRPCMVYGYDEPHILKTLLDLVKKRLFLILNHGVNRLHLVYVKNVVDFMIFSATCDKCSEGSFFIADDEVLTTKQIFDLIAKSLGVKPPVVLNNPISIILKKVPFIGKKLGFFAKDRVYSLSKIKTLGFKHKYSMQESFLKSCEKMNGVL